MLRKVFYSPSGSCGIFLACQVATTPIFDLFFILSVVALSVVLACVCLLFLGVSGLKRPVSMWMTRHSLLQCGKPSVHNCKIVSRYGLPSQMRLMMVLKEAQRDPEDMVTRKVSPCVTKLKSAISDTEGMLDPHTLAGIEDEDWLPNSFGNDEEGALLCINGMPTEFDKICDSVSAQISSWKGGAPVTEQDIDAALVKMSSLKSKHHELQVRTSAISQELLEVKQMLKAEVIARVADIKRLSDEVQDLKKDKLELRRIMLVRALSTSLQHHLTVQFPGLFGTKYTFSCTYDNIVAKVTKSGNAVHQLTLKRIEQLFIDEGVEPEDIAPMIKQIRELGTSTSHPCTMVSVTGEEYVPSFAQLEEIISVVNLDESLKKDAKVLLNVLLKVVQSDAELFSSNV